jgi:hypothetical protein
MTGQQMPVAKFKAGQVASAIWENEVQMARGPVKILKATIQRRYKDKAGTWQSSTSFGRNEIPLAIHCLQKAFEKIIEKQNEEAGTSTNVEEVFI